MSLRTDPQTLVMAVLKDGPGHGYSLAKALREALGQAQSPRSAQVYVALRSLEAKGWATCEPCADEEERRVYRLTEAGRQELDWRTQEWHDAVGTIARLLPLAET